ncbi:hypothetical protein CO024_02605 [Candidatus Gracilibacteria bacterium CG_4_9_14_0_2_um_filter_38_7]|nr:MAG: hypothetical protein AUJ87_01245 [Candidatus Gracilibacteria bacterium CG1_02_38_174]PIQ10859.1 MAG: hypothetical protein COW68_03645 [Candidatus Gracilibacteria bacterium CG18_big_fil_WC_8_21_14_2_50_38_16]PIQ41198.1 MAG: hypothetical protein COW06_03765 [Candidatus Gracilibacteria bacterium CG12_big_fil_rev_8_21_14_0_65_38_15]PIZ01529.1 MAG: hypothetical protein COY60_03060 [Candidatus Gracilibacteria bacterium CG_4_10_14_0_8_um_filter_38_28]PJC56522.1 MAG: hypothetical protein CO024_
MFTFLILKYFGISIGSFLFCIWFVLIILDYFHGVPVGIPIKYSSLNINKSLGNFPFDSLRIWKSLLQIGSRNAVLFLFLSFFRFFLSLKKYK